MTLLDSVMGSAQNPLSMNRFLYAQANPATLIDPTGHVACHQEADYCQSGSNPNGIRNPANPGNAVSPSTPPSADAIEAAYIKANKSAKPKSSSTPTSGTAYLPTGPAVPAWLSGEYRDYLMSPQYLYLDRQIPRSSGPSRRRGWRSPASTSAT